MKKAFSRKHAFLIPLLLTFVLSGCDLGVFKNTMNLTPLKNLSSQWKVVSGSLVLKSVGDDQVADLVGIVTPNASGVLNTDTSPKAYTLQMDKGLSKPLSIDWKSMRAYFRYDVNLKTSLGQMFFVNLETEEVIHLFVKQAKADKKKEVLLTEIGWPKNRKEKLITYEGFGLLEHEGKMVTNATTLSKTETELFKQFAH